MEVTCVIKGIIEVTMVDVNVRAQQDLKKRLGFPNVDRITKEKMGYPVADLPKTLYKADFSIEGVVGIDRCCYPILADWLKFWNVRASFVDLRTRIPVTFPPFKPTLNDYQTTTLDTTMASLSGGIIHVPTAGGKTVIGLAAVQKLGQRTLILVHTNDLLEQWASRIESCIPGAKVGKYTGLKKKEGEMITLSTLQTMYRISPDDPIWKNYGLVVVDEVHHLGAVTFKAVLGRLYAAKRLGLSATIKRSDGKSPFLHSVIGETLVTLDYTDIAERIIVPDVYPVSFYSGETEFPFYVNKWIRNERQIVVDYTKYYRFLAESGARNHLIARLAGEAAKLGSVLILTKLVDHAILLEKGLNSLGISTVALFGMGKSKKERAAILSKVANKEVSVLIGTSVADEGLDLPGLQSLILAAPTSDIQKLMQRVGRVIRIAEGKTACTIYDIVDMDIPEAVKAYSHRKALARKMGSEVILEHWQEDPIPF